VRASYVRLDASAALESLRVLGVSEYFSIVITGEDVRSPKPAPDIFLLAAQKLNVNLEMLSWWKTPLRVCRPPLLVE